MKQLKAAVNWLPVVVVLTIAALSFQRWQAYQATIPDYEGSSPRPTVLAPNKPGQSEIGEVVKVLDGDTITVRVDGREDRVRFCGIDAPEVGHEGKPGQPLGDESRDWLRSLISAAGNQVIISPAEREPCGICGAARYGRLVAEVFVSAGKGTEE